MNKTFLTLILMCIPSIAYGQSQVSIALGSGYAGGTVVVTTVNPNGSTAPVRSTFLDGNGASVLSWLPTGAKNIIIVCKIDNTSCLGTVAQPTGNVQDITTALQANPIGSGSSVFPLTISGTVNSGGIPCFTSTTVEASSAAVPLDGLIYGGGAGTCILVLAPPTTPSNVPQYLTSTNASGVATAPAFTLSGEPGRSVAGASDAILATDRSSCVLYTNGGAVAVTIAAAGSTGFTNNFNWCMKAATTTVVTLTPTTSTVAGNNGTLASTLVMPVSSTAYCYSWDNTNYQCSVVSSGGIAYGNGTGSVNAMTVTTVPAVATNAAGTLVEVLPNLANTTTTPTLNVGGAGAQTITKGPANNALVAGDYGITQNAIFLSDGTHWQLLNPQAEVITGGTTAGYKTWTQGSTSAAVGQCPASNTICEQAPASVTSYLVNKPGVAASGIRVNTTAAAVATENFTGNAAFSTGAVTIGSGSSISATSLCSTANCPAGNYDVAGYVEITTPCTTTGSYIVWLGWTDDGSAKNGSSTTTFFPFPLNGSGIPTTVGTIVPAAAGNYAQAHIFLHTTGAANNSLGSINYGTTATACGTGGPMVGKLFLTVTPLS